MGDEAPPANTEQDPRGPERLDLRGDLRLLGRCLWSPEAVAGTIAMALAIVMWNYFARRPYGPVSRELTYWVSHLIGLVAVPLALAWAGFRIGPREMGLGLGRPRVWAPYIGVCFLLVYPPVLWAGSRGEFQNFYPLWDGARQSPSNFLLHQVVMFSVIFANEFFFRGFMLSTYARRMPPSAAIVCAMVPYVWGHAAKPPLEFASSILAGLALGVVAWRGKSIWPGVVLHFLVSCTIDSMAAPEAARQVLSLLGAGS